jgi:hypothetical protein
MPPANRYDFIAALGLDIHVGREHGRRTRSNALRIPQQRASRGHSLQWTVVIDALMCAPISIEYMARISDSCLSMQLTI